MFDKMSQMMKNKERMTLTEDLKEATADLWNTKNGFVIYFLYHKILGKYIGGSGLGWSDCDRVRQYLKLGHSVSLNAAFGVSKVDWHVSLAYKSKMYHNGPDGKKYIPSDRSCRYDKFYAEWYYYNYYKQIYPNDLLNEISPLRL
eukprot:436415_1